MKKSLLFFALLLLLFSLFFILNNKQVFAQETGKIRVIYFYSPECPKCQQIEPFIKEIKEKYEGKIEFLEHNVREQEQCRQLFFQFIEKYNVPIEKAGTPIIFIGKNYLAGPKDIKNYLEENIERKITNNENLLIDCHEFLENWPNVEKINLNGNAGSEVCGIDSQSYCVAADKNPNKFKNISLALIITTAAIDSINPCAIAVLIFLLGILISIKSSKRKIIKIGLVYILAVFLTYYLAGIGLIGIITRYDIANEISFFAGIIVLFAGLLEIKEGLYPDGKQLLRIPEKTKPIFASFLKKATVPSVFIAGVLVSAFELPCTGQVYLGILSMLSQENMKSEGYLYLLIYNFVFVLPLILILLVSAWGFDIKRMEKTRKKTRTLIKILMGLIMITLGIFLLFQDKIMSILDI